MTSKVYVVFERSLNEEDEVVGVFRHATRAALCKEANPHNRVIVTYLNVEVEGVFDNGMD